MRQAAPGTPGAPGGPPTKAFLESYRPGAPTPPTPDDKAKVEAAKSYYSKLSSGLGDTAQKGAIQALPGLTADMGMNEQDMGVPGTEPYKSASTLSPDFQGYTPRQPKPY